jgi:hypothetical protein
MGRACSTCEKRNAFNVFGGKTKMKKLRNMSEDDIKMDFGEMR